MRFYNLKALILPLMITCISCDTFKPSVSDSSQETKTTVSTIVETQNTKTDKDTITFIDPNDTRPSFPVYPVETYLTSIQRDGDRCVLNIFSKKAYDEELVTKESDYYKKNDSAKEHAADAAYLNNTLALSYYISDIKKINQATDKNIQQISFNEINPFYSRIVLNSNLEKEQYLFLRYHGDKDIFRPGRFSYTITVPPCKSFFVEDPQKETIIFDSDTFSKLREHVDCPTHKSFIPKKDILSLIHISEPTRPY